MIFGPVAISDALGATLAHSIKVSGGRLRKGIVLSQSDITALHDAGLQDVTVAIMDAGDIDENSAAKALAEALVPDPSAAGLALSVPTTGRVNLIAQAPGVARIDRAAIDAVNAVHPMITCATVLPYTRAEAGTLIATIKIISYAVPRDALNAACDAARSALALSQVVLKNADLIVTDTGAGPDDAKGIAAIQMRLNRLGMTLEKVSKTNHNSHAIAAEIEKSTADMVLILTASATSDVHDTAPEALKLAGGSITRFGMPVDPGNLLFLGHIQNKPVIGLPGCARAPALNGADWVLERTVCGLDISSTDIAQMGVGGLLKEIPQRPQPRRP